MKITIKIRGCDATTECEVDVTPEEIKGIFKLAEASTIESASLYECYPNIQTIKQDGTIVWDAEYFKEQRKEK